MTIEQPCIECGTPFPFNPYRLFCSNKCRRKHYKCQATPKPKVPVVRVPSKKRKVAVTVLGIEIPQLAWDRFLWLRCLIQEIEKLEQRCETVI